MFGLGMPELIIIMVIVLMIFGAGKLGDIGGALGKGIKSFRKSASEVDEIAKSDILEKKEDLPKQA